MKKIQILLAITALALITACYEDKGNYEYRDIRPFEIDMGQGAGSAHYYTLYLTMGEVVEINPKIIFADGEGNTDHLTYSWYLIPNNNSKPDEKYREDDWNTLNFKWTPDFLITTGILVLQVTDTTNDLLYTAKVGLTVRSRYEADGAMILAEKEGKTQFSFLKGVEKDGVIGTIPIKFEINNNVYFTENGEDLPADPIKMHEHYCSDLSTAGQILILTKNGAVDINGLDFKKDIDLTEAFEDKAYPAGFGYASNAIFMKRVDLLFDAEGYIYSRLRNTDALFHSGYFLPNRLQLDGEEEPLQNCHPILAPSNNIRACVLYDPQKKRFLLIGDTNINNQAPEENASRPALLPNTTSVPKGEASLFMPINNLGDDAEILSIDYYRPDMSSGYSIVFYKDGKTYIQEFEIEKVWNVFGYSIENPAVYEIKGLPAKPTFILAQPYYNSMTWSNNPLLFCAIGNELYVFDRTNPSVPVVKYEPKDPEGNPLPDVFNSDIIAMNAENFGSRWAVVGLANGRVIILKTMQANYPEDQIVYYSSGDYSYGSIKSVLCKTGGANW